VYFTQLSICRTLRFCRITWHWSCKLRLSPSPRPTESA